MGVVKDEVWLAKLEEIKSNGKLVRLRVGRSFYILAGKDLTDDEIWSYMYRFDLGDSPSWAYTKIFDKDGELDVVSNIRCVGEARKDDIVYNMPPFDDLDNWIDLTVAEVVKLIHGNMLAEIKACLEI